MEDEIGRKQIGKVKLKTNKKVWKEKMRCFTFYMNNEAQQQGGWPGTP